jgi:hypothetical protein
VRRKKRDGAAALALRHRTKDGCEALEGLAERLRRGQAKRRRSSSQATPDVDAAGAAAPDAAAVSPDANPGVDPDACAAAAAIAT